LSMAKCRPFDVAQGRPEAPDGRMLNAKAIGLVRHLAVVIWH
jgi:hypothetical protein